MIIILGSLESADFLLVLIELFSLGVIRLRRYERISVQNRQ